MPRADGVNYTGGNEMWGGYGTYGEVPSRSSRVPIVKFALVPFRELGDKSPPPFRG